MQLLAQAFKKDNRQAVIIIVPSLGSGGGLKALRAGAIDMAVISRPLKDAERSAALTASEYARTPLLFAPALSTNLSSITTRELVEIYNGQRKTWPDGQTLRLVLRPKSESDADMIKSMSPDMAQAVTVALGREGLTVALTDKSNAYNLKKVPGVVGTTTLAQIISENRQLKPLALNGVTPNLSALDAGKYGLYKHLFFVLGTTPSPLTVRFAAWLLSDAGREILRNNGNWVAPAQ